MPDHHLAEACFDYLCTALSATQLNAPRRFRYLRYALPPAMRSAGVQTLTVTFTRATPRSMQAQASVQLSVTKDTGH